MRWLAVGVVLLAARGGLAADGQRCFTGYAYHLDSDQFAYSEHHEQQLTDGAAVHWKVTYRNPDGSVRAIKTLDFSHHPFVPVYEMTIAGEGYAEGIAHDGDWRLYRRETENADTKRETFKIQPPIAGDAGFHPFLLSRFDALMAGERVPFSMATAGHLAVLAMQAKRIEDTRFQGRKAVVFRAELDMFFINWFVDALELVYDPNTKRLLEYRGISNMHTDAGETFNVRVSYYRDPPDDAPDVPTGCGGRAVANPP